MSAALIRVLGLLVTLTARDIHGFSQGAPPTQCGAMMPNHGAAPQSGAAPYLLTPSKFTYSPMEQITVRLIPNGVEGFKGFLLEARDGGQPVGRFITNPQNAYQALDCGGLAGTALTHTSGFTQNAVEVIWEAPSGPPASGNGIKFRATIVRSFPEFWVGVETQELTYQQTTTHVPTGSSATVGTGTNNTSNMGARDMRRNMGSSGNILASSQSFLTVALLSAAMCIRFLSLVNFLF